MSGGYDQFFQKARRATHEGGGQKGAQEKGGPSKLFSGKDPGVRFSLSSKAAKRAAGREMDPAMFALNQAASKGSPEEQLRLELARRLKAKKNKAIRQRQKFPVFPTVCVTAALVSCTVGYFRPDLYDAATKVFHQYVGTYIEPLGQYVDIGFFGSANAAASEGHKAAGAKSETKHDAAKSEANHDAAKGVPAGEKSAEGANVAGEIAAATNGEAKEENVPNIRNWTPEELSFFNKLNERKKELDLREAELTKLDEELQKQKEELDEKIKQLEAMRSQISQTLKSRVATDQQKVDKLVDFYSNMKPQQAAKVIETLNEDLSVEVLDKMKKKNAAEILNAMDAKKARRLSELLAGYQRTPAAATEESPKAATAE
jgi:flagellar motility protein MotE (MotC chaperone)